jgi:molybdate transport system substrate-binding protein
MNIITRKPALIILFFLFLGSACRPQVESAANQKSNNQQLTIYAAASLVSAFTELGQAFQAAHPGVEVVTSFAGSQQIAQQLSQGAPGDLFASANKKQMDNVINAGRVSVGSAQEFTSNQLVLVLPRDNPGDIQQFKDISKPGLHIILADDSVPVGAYSQETLERANQSPGYGERFLDQVLANVVSYEENVRAVLTKVILGEADAGIVYVSDAASLSTDDFQQVTIPQEINIRASYYLAALMDSPHHQLAQDFISFVLSPQGQDILNKHGFTRIDEHE